MKKWQLLIGVVGVVGGLYLLNERLSRRPAQYMPGGAASTVETAGGPARDQFAVGFLPVT